MSVWPDIVRDLTDYAKKFENHDAPKWFSKLLQYNVTTGKKNRGLVVVMAYKILKQNGELNDEELKLVQCLGWCVEMVSNLCLNIIRYSCGRSKLNLNLLPPIPFNLSDNFKIILSYHSFSCKQFLLLMTI